jgi:hypothetical protein
MAPKVSKTAYWRANEAFRVIRTRTHPAALGS